MSTARRNRFALMTLLCSVFLAAMLAGCTVDKAARDNAAQTRTTSSEQSAKTSLPDLSFQTKDINGNSVSMSDLADAKVILVNLWEPWCGPCVAELPYLQELYERYADQGLVIIGAYTSNDQKSDILDLMNEHGITYPIVYANDGFAPYRTRYVPTSMVFDGSGHPLIEEPLVGSRSYRQWEQLVLKYL